MQSIQLPPTTCLPKGRDSWRKCSKRASQGQRMQQQLGGLLLVTSVVFRHKIPTVAGHNPLSKTGTRESTPQPVCRWWWAEEPAPSPGDLPGTRPSPKELTPGQCGTSHREGSRLVSLQDGRSLKRQQRIRTQARETGKAMFL